MKTVTILSLLLLVSPVFGELTKEDIRTIFKEENAASEKRLKEYIDLKIDAVEKNLNAKIDAVERNLNTKIEAGDKNLNTKIEALEKNLNDRIGDIRIIMIALIGLITAAIAIPQIIIAYRDRGQKEMQIQIDQLRKELEAMQQ